VSGADAATLRGSFEACAEITRRSAGNFYHGLKLTPSPQREGLFALYAWMRLVDDIVDGEGEFAEASAQVAGGDAIARRSGELDAFAAATETALAGRVPDDAPLWPAFVETARRHRLPAPPFREMIEGQRQDLEPIPMPDWPALERFCHRVASTVGVLCVRIWGAEDGLSLELAETQGIAFQLTNILRDLREDAARGRTYLPQEDLAAAGISIDGVLSWSDPDAASRALRPTIRRARCCYDRSAPLLGRIPPACRPTLWAMTRIYRGIFERIEAAPQRIAAPRRVGLSTLRKVTIAWEAKRLGRRWSREPALPATPP